MRLPSSGARTFGEVEDIMGSPNNSRHGKCILELKKAKNLRASKILGNNWKLGWFALV